MDRKAIKSSNIVSVGYDAGTETLEVEFKGGRIYRYMAVPAAKHAEMMEAESIGSFLATQIKGHHEYVQLPKEEVEAY